MQPGDLWRCIHIELPDPVLGRHDSPTSDINHLALQVVERMLLEDRADLLLHRPILLATLLPAHHEKRPLRQTGPELIVHQGLLTRVNPHSRRVAISRPLRRGTGPQETVGG